MSVASSQEMLMLARNFALFAPPITSRPDVNAGVPGRKLDLSGPVMGARDRLLHRLGKAGAMTIANHRGLVGGCRARTEQR